MEPEKRKYNPDNYGAGAGPLAAVLLALLIVCGGLFYVVFWYATLHH